MCYVRLYGQCNSIFVFCWCLVALSLVTGQYSAASKARFPSLMRVSTAYLHSLGCFFPPLGTRFKIAWLILLFEDSVTNDLTGSLNLGYKMPIFSYACKSWIGPSFAVHVHPQDPSDGSSACIFC